MSASVDEPAGPGPRAGRREWIGLAMLALPALLVSMDLTVLHLAVPEISADLQPSSSQLLWIVDVYGFMIAGFLITMGTVGDRIGRRKLLLIGAAAFGVASVLVAFSTSAEMLIASRALLGIAGATLMPSTLALVRNMFHDAQQRTVAVSVVLMSILGGAAIGPLIGGGLLEFFWWGSVFLIGVPVMALLLLTGPRLLLEYRNPDACRLDLASAAMSLTAMLAVICGLKEIASDGLALLAVFAIIGGLAVGIVFVRRQRTLADPLLDLSLFAKRAFSVSLGALTVGALVLGGVGFLTAQYLQLVLELSALEAGLWMLPPLVTGVLATMLAPTLVRRVRPGYVIGAGLGLASIGFALLSQVGDSSGLAIIVIANMLAFAGLLPASTLGVDIVLSSAPPERAGAASSISETTQEFGLALGIAVLGSVATAVYRGEVTETALAGAPSDAADAARDTLGGAVGAAEQLAPALLQTATEAFTNGLQVAAALSAVLLAATGVLAAIVLRSARADSGSDAVPVPDDAAAAFTQVTTSRRPVPAAGPA